MGANRRVKSFIAKIINVPLHVFGIHLGQWRNVKTEPLAYNTEVLKRALFFRDLLHQIKNVDGAIVECGVGWGRSLAHIMALSEADPELPKRKIIGYDSFAGFPDPSDEDDYIRTGVRAGRYKTSKKKVEQFLKNMNLHSQNLRSDLELVKGMFEDTIPNSNTGQIALLNLDGDLYGSYKICLDNLLDRMAVGGIIIFDEFSSEKYPGCRKAVLEYFEEKDIKQHPIWPRHYIIVGK